MTTVIWSDNVGAEGSVRKGCRASLRGAMLGSVCDVLTGTSKRFDHSCIAHCLWKRLLELNVSAWIERAPTDDNIADDPTRRVFQSINRPWHARLCGARGRYTLLHSIEAQPVEAMLDDLFIDPSAWESLSLAPRCASS